MKWKVKGTEWGEYYKHLNYSNEAFSSKKHIVTDFLDRTRPKTLWDLGANTGVFSRIASKKGIQTISFDLDPIAVEENYLQCFKEGQLNILPLLVDLTNPSPALGWEHRERLSLIERGPADMVMALALIHHLAISNNIPLERAALFFTQLCSFLVIEFIPKTDSQVQRLLATREDIFPNYTQENFEKAFSKCFSIQSCRRIPESERTLYLMQRRANHF